MPPEWPSNVIGYRPPVDPRDAEIANLRSLLGEAARAIMAPTILGQPYLDGLLKRIEEEAGP